MSAHVMNSTRGERLLRTKECFEKLMKSRAHEPEVDEDIWIARCEEAGLEGTYWGKPGKEELIKLCRKCPLNTREDRQNE